MPQKVLRTKYDRFLLIRRMILKTFPYEAGLVKAEDVYLKPGGAFATARRVTIL